LIYNSLHFPQLVPSNLYILLPIISHTTHLSHTHCIMATSPPGLRVVLEALATIPAATALTIWSIKARSETGFDATIDTTSRGTLSPPVYPMPRAMIPLPNETPNHLEVLLTRPSRSVLMLQVHEKRCLPRDPNLDHSHNENSGHFPELGMDQSWLLVLF